jgi:hypothetical protein
LAWVIGADDTVGPATTRPPRGGPVVHFRAEADSARGWTFAGGAKPTVGAMTTLALKPADTAVRTSAVGAALLALGCVVLAYLDFFVTTSDGKFVSAADYVYTVDMLPLLVGLFLLVSGLRGVQSGRDGKLGTAGFVVLTVGLVGLTVTGVDSMITKDAQALGPVYVLSTFATFIGLILFAIGGLRARVLPWWMGPLLTIAWVVGGTVGDGGPLGFKGSALLAAAAGIACASGAAKAAAR